MVEQAPTNKAVICDTPNATPTEGGDAQAMPLTSAAASEEAVPAAPAVPVAQAAPTPDNDMAKALNEIAPAAGTLADKPQAAPSPEVCAVPQGSQQATAEQIANAVTINKPAANETVTYQIAAGQDYNLTFSTKDALVESQGQNLVIRFADGSVVILEQFDNVASNNHIIVDGCQVVSGSDYTQMAGLASSLAEIAPAAGGQAAAATGAQANTAPGNSGAGFSQFSDAGLPNGPSPLGPLGATALNYRLIDGLTPEGGLTRGLDGKPSIGLETPLNVVDETGGGGTGGVFDAPRVNSGNFNFDLGRDGPGFIRIIDGPVALTHHGDPIIVTISPDGLTATGTTTGGETIFTFSIDPATKTYTFTQHGSLDHPDPTDPNEALDLPFVIRVQDADGDYVDGTAVMRVLDDAPSIVAPATVEVDETTGGTLVTGGVINFSYGGDGAGSIKLVGGPAGLTSGGTAVAVTVTDTVITGTAGGVTVFTLTLNPATGAWDYKQFAPLDHADGSNPDDALGLGFTVRVTDYDGDSVDTSITVVVKDDGPDAFAAVNSADETGGFDTVSGNLNFSYGADGAGSLKLSSVPTGLTSGGQPVTVTLSADGLTATGTTPGGATVFTLTVTATGEYVFKQLAQLDHPDSNNPDDVLSLGFGYTVTDRDGDSVSSSLTIEVRDDGPLAGTASNIVDETGGFDTVSGTVALGYGADGKGSFAITSLPAGLTSHGVAVVNTVSADGLTVTGKAGDVTVYTFTLNPATGAYTFTQLAALDHPNTADHNDTLNLGFGFTVTDADGDKASGSVSIAVRDDGPTAGSAQNSVDETGGFDTVSGSVSIGFGADGKGSVTITGLPVGLTSHGVAVTNSLSADGLTITGKAGDVTVYTFTLNPATGTYTFTQLAALDHPNTGDHNDALNLGFGFTVTDADGDTASGSVTVVVRDDGPAAGTATNTVDETGGFDSVSGTVGVSYGADGKGSIGFTSLPTGLTAHGVAVTNSVSSDGLIITGKAGNVTVYTLTFNPATGAYTFTQLAALDHPNASDHNDALVLNFGFKVTDADGDSANGNIGITVLDDGPTAGSVAIDNVRAGDPEYSGSVPFTYGADGAGKVALTSAGDGPLGMTGLTSGGKAIKVTLTEGGAVGKLEDGTVAFELKLSADGKYTYKQNLKIDGNPDLKFGYTVADADGDKAKGTITVDTANGVPTACDVVTKVDETGGFDTISGKLLFDFGPDGAPTGPVGVGAVRFVSGPTGLTSKGVPVEVIFTTDGQSVMGRAGDKIVFTLSVNDKGEYTFTQFAQLDHPNPNNHDDILALGFGFRVTDRDGDTANATLTVNVHDDGPTAGASAVAVDETGGFDTVSGQLNFSYGQDGAGSVRLTAGASGVTSHGVSVTNTVSADGLTITGKAGDVTVYTLTLNAATGQYTFTQLAALDHGNTGNPNDALTLGFGFKVTDYDGDTATGSISVTVCDDGPSATISTVTVDETGGFDTVTGNLTFSYGQDGAGSVKLTSGPSGLSSAGKPVTIVVSADGLTVTGVVAGGGDVFSLTLNPATGAYTFKQLAQLDHPDASNPNDVLNLGFGVKVTDGDGDSVTTQIKVAVYDDAPKANDDVNEVASGSNTATGNVITGLNGGAGAADQLSMDGPNKISQISFGGTTVGVPASGTASIEGKYGTLVIAADGSYTYTLKPGAGAGGKTVTVNPMTFTDVSTGAKIELKAVQTADGVEFTIKGLTAGVDLNKFVLDLGADGSIDFAKLLGSQTRTDPHVGEAKFVVPGIDAEKLKDAYVEIKATATGACGCDSFTVCGKMSVTVVENCGCEPTKDQFTYVLVDADGDPSKATLTIGSDDCKPEATDSLVKVDETGGFDTVTNSLTYSYGQDGAGSVKFTSTPAGLTSHGVNVVSTISADGLTVTGKAGDVTIYTLTLNPATGSYTFKQLAALDHPNASNPDDVLNLGFGYKVTDKDGDTASAKLTVAVYDDGPSAGTSTAGVDETGGFDTASGTLSFSFGQDGAGSIKLTSGQNGLTSHGVAVVNTVSADGLTVTGKAGDVTVYTLTLNAQTGAYVFKQLAALDHPNTADHNDALNLGFGFKVTDGDGDTANGSLTVTVCDDGPAAGNAKSTLDETSARDSVGAKDDGIWATQSSGTPLAATGKVAFSYGMDGAGSVQLTTLPSGLTHHGQAVGITLVGNTATGKLADGTLVFTLSLDAATGNYTYKQYASLDHADKSNPDDVLGFSFGYKVTDGDGDSAAGKIEFCVNDDGPAASISTLKVDQSCLQDDCNPATPLFTATSALDFGYGNDGKGKVALSSVPTGLYSNGQVVTSVLVGNLITGKLASGQTVYTLELDVGTGKYTYKQYAEIDTSGQSNTTLNVGYKVVDADGDTAESKIKVEVSGDLCDPKLPPAICVSVDVNVTTKSETVQFGHDFSETRIWKAPVEGKAADKILVGMSSDNLTVGGNYTVPTGLIGGTPQHKVSLVFEGETAGFSNTLGWFIVGPHGEMNYSKIAVMNSDAFAKGGKVDLGYVDAGSEIEFFLIPNGAQLNNYAGLPAGGEYQFWSGGAPGAAGAHLATVNDAAGSIKLYYVAGGTSVEIKTAEGGVWFASHETLNKDGLDHVISGVDTAHPDQIWIGFEDRSLATGDRDYNDLMFCVEVGDACGTIVKTCSDMDLSACITDPDSTQLSGAVIALTQHVAGDILELGNGYTLAGANVLRNGVDTGVDLAKTADGGFTLSGNASLDTYQGIISSAELHNSNGTLTGSRTISFQVTDETGLKSNIASVQFGYADNTYGDDDCLSCGVTDHVAGLDKAYIRTDGDVSKTVSEKLSLHAVLDGHTGSMDDLSQYVKVEADGHGNTVVKVDVTGTGEHFESAAIFHGVTGVTLDSMVSDGSIDVGRFLNG